MLARIERLAGGNPGDVKAVGEGVYELRIDHGPGYRVYFAKHRGGAIVLLTGGVKNSQRADIRLAQRLAAELRRELR